MKKLIFQSICAHHDLLPSDKRVLRNGEQLKHTRVKLRVEPRRG
jgi:hypothetical protein